MYVYGTLTVCPDLVTVPVVLIVFVVSLSVVFQVLSVDAVVFASADVLLATLADVKITDPRFKFEAGETPKLTLTK